MAQKLIGIAGLLGALAVGLGAFGAHGLQGKLAGVEDASKRMGWWETAAHYHLVHALALAVTAVVVARHASGWATAAGASFGFGVLVFSGTLYAMALGAPRWFGAITPIGGLALLFGWVALAVAGWRAFT